MSWPHHATLTVAPRFAGPPGSGNGGYVAGRIAVLLGVGDAPLQVTLRRPPPLSVPLELTADDSRATVTSDGVLVVEAAPAGLTRDAVDPVPFSVAAASMDSYLGLAQHPFPGCFVCGTDRPAPDGLGLRPGRVPDRPGTVATTWVPDASLTAAGRGEVPTEIVWAALDCPGGWSSDLVGRPMVLGRMTCAVAATPEVGDRCVVLGRVVSAEGRKAFTTSTAYDEDGRVLGQAEAVWIQVDPSQLPR